MRGFSIITSKLKEMYQMITLGGDAELELVDSLDPFSEGINFRSASYLPPPPPFSLPTNPSSLFPSFCRVYLFFFFLIY
jgi:hypothetical protein